MASTLSIIIKLLKEGNADKETIFALKEVQKTVGNVTAVAGAMAAAYGFVDQVLGESVRTTVAYADQVRTMMQLTGQSAEESSRTIQVMDDLKVSTEALTMATKTLAKEGLTMNIETLAKLSDEYRSLGNGADKTAFLVEHFGKTGLQMAEAMEQGGDALRKMSNEVEGSLVLNAQAVESTRQYQRELDNLNDEFDAIKVQLGRDIIPLILNVISETKQLQNATEALNTTEKTHGTIMANSAEAAKTLRAAHEAQTNAVDSATRSYTAMAQAAQTSTTSAQDLAEAEKAAAEAAKELTKANQMILSTVSSMQSAEESYQDALKRNAEERAKIEKDRADEIAKGWKTDAERVAEYDQALAENARQVQTLAQEHEMASRKIVLGLIQQKMTADGILTDDEMNWLLKKGEQWGIYSDTVVKEAQRAIAEANMVAAAVNGIPDAKTIEIYLHSNFGGGDLGDHVADNRERDSGGPGKAGQAYIINPSAGPEMFVPATDGYFVPNVDQLAGGQTIVVNFYNQPSLSISAREDAKEAARPIVEEIVRRMR